MAISRLQYFKLLYVLICLHFITDFVHGIKLIEVSIPKHTDLRRSVQLSCKFEIKYGKLYSVKWYKDEFEFFRYMPDNIPRIQTFPVPGVILDVSKSNMTTITLHRLNFNSTGNYRCEVSKDGPNFETLVRNGNMTVMVYPEENPVISGIQTRYAVGDYIEGNCTSSWSNPAAELSWLINERKADSWLLEKLEMKTNNSSLESVTLYSQGLRLRFQLEKSHFQNGYLKLRCSSKIMSDIPTRDQVLIIYSDPPITEGIQAQNRLNNSDSSSFCNRSKWITLFMISTIIINFSFT